MKLAIAGAHGVGKTTLQFCLQRMLPEQTTLIPDFGRICPFPTGMSTTSEAQEWILSRQIQAEGIFEHSDETVIFDNISLAHYAYYHRKRGGNPTLENVAAVSAKTFNNIIYLPPTEGWLIDDGLRPIDIEFQTSIYKHQIELFNRHSVKLLLPESGWQKWDGTEWLAYLQTKLVKVKATNTITQLMVALGLVEKNGSILLILRNNPNNPDAHNKWDIPGGTVELLESVLTTAAREVLEETGYFVKSTGYHGNPVQNIWTLNNGNKLHINLVCIRCELLVDAPILTPQDNKVSDIRWFTKDEIKNLDLIKGIRQYLL